MQKCVQRCHQLAVTWPAGAACQGARSSCTRQQVHQEQRDARTTRSLAASPEGKAAASSADARQVSTIACTKPAICRPATVPQIVGTGRSSARLKSVLCLAAARAWVWLTSQPKTLNKIFHTCATGCSQRGTCR